MVLVRVPVLFLVLPGTVVDIATSAADLLGLAAAHGTLPAAFILHFSRETLTQLTGPPCVAHSLASHTSPNSSIFAPSFSPPPPTPTYHLSSFARDLINKNMTIFYLCVLFCFLLRAIHHQLIIDCFDLKPDAINGRRRWRRRWRHRRWEPVASFTEPQLTIHCGFISFPAVRGWNQGGGGRRGEEGGFI